MAAWFEFFLYALRETVALYFSLDLGLGFSLGDFLVGCLVLVVVSSLIIRSTSNLGGSRIGERDA